METSRQGRPAISADPAQWSEPSKRSAAFGCRREYRDMPYQCRHCKAACVFTAQQQKTAYEVRKASIHQRRSLCQACWLASRRLRKAARACEEQWRADKAGLKADAAFLDRWLGLLVALEAYVPYRPDTARKNMLSRLLAACRMATGTPGAH